LHSPTDAVAGAERRPGRTVFLVRHATPDLTRTDLVYFLPPGPPLTTAGELEASELGLFLRRRGVRWIWTSPLERAARTAELAASVCAAQVIEDARLIEMRPDESHDDVRARAGPVWDVAVGRAVVHGPQALVAHGGVITALLLAVGLAPRFLERVGRHFDSGNPVPPGGAWEVNRSDGDRSWAARLAFLPGADRRGRGRRGCVITPTSAKGDPT
jgi:broad specificity phosphatase PhoE